MLCGTHAGVGELRVTVRRVRLQYKKALEQPVCVVSLVAQDGALIEECRTQAGGWDKPNQVIVLEQSLALSTRVSAIPEGECWRAAPAATAQSDGTASCKQEALMNSMKLAFCTGL